MHKDRFGSGSLEVPSRGQIYLLLSTSKQTMLMQNGAITD